MICDPDTTKGFETVISDYDGDLKIQINPKYFTEWFVFFKHYYEADIVKLVKKHLPKDGVFVDVGADIGALSLIAAKIARRVVAIEPCPFAADRLRKNFNMNDLYAVHEVHECCASDKEGPSVSFYLPAGGNRHSGMGSLYQEHAQGEEIKVPVKMLDSILGGRKIDFIKIDTEGHDQFALMGARKTIEKYRPVIIYENTPFESTSLERNTSVAASMLQSLGYTITRIDVSNVLCLPNTT